jgi:hypothetical protein
LIEAHAAREAFLREEADVVKQQLVDFARA